MIRMSAIVFKSLLCSGTLPPPPTPLRQPVCSSMLAELPAVSGIDVHCGRGARLRQFRCRGQFPRQLRMEPHEPQKPHARPSKTPFPSVHRRCSGFCSGLNGDSTQIPNDVTKPIEKAVYRNSTEFIEYPEENPNRRLVREERVELSTFGSGGRRSIQLSYSRRPTRH